jgi:hypothetical protein
VHVAWLFDVNAKALAWLKAAHNNIMATSQLVCKIAHILCTDLLNGDVSFKPPQFQLTAIQMFERDPMKRICDGSATYSVKFPVHKKPK